MNVSKVSVALLLMSLGFIGACKRPPKPVAVDPPIAYPAKVRLIVDSSASMAGYFAGSTEYKDTLADMAASLDRLSTENKGVKPVEYVLLGDRGTLQPETLSTNEFIQQMRTNRLMQHGDSLLSSAFRNILESNAPDQVSLLVTDAIVSYPDADIRANPRVNIDNAASLGAEVETVFAPAAQKDMGTVLFGGLSAFHGTYYDYSNQHLRCCAGKRPFYVWLLGPSSQVKALAAYLEQQHLAFEQELAFGGKTVEAKAVVLQSLRRSPGSVYYRAQADPSTVEVKAFPSSGPLRFAVALDLHKLPPSQQRPEFLREHLHVSDTDHALSIEEIDARATVEAEKNNDAAGHLDSYTHVIFLALRPGFRDGDQAKLTVDAALPGWYREWSNVDDSKTDREKVPTTFGLVYLVDGVSKAFGNGGPLAEVSLKVRK